MTERREFTFQVAVTRHFEFRVWATSEADAREQGGQIWRDAPTTGQWELPDEDVEYSVYPSPTPPERKT